MATSVVRQIPQRRMALRTSSDLKHAISLVCCLVLLAATMTITGCGNGGDSSEAPPTPTGQAQLTHTAASGPAISDKLSFDQLTLESPAKQEKDQHGLLFLRFKYADSDGKVYVCVLPKAMSEGQFSLAEWSSTFAAYRLPAVVAVKKKDSKMDLGDYPFISPRPQQQQQQPQAAPDVAQPQPPMALPPAPMPQGGGVNAPGLGGPPP